MTSWATKKFWKNAEVAATEGGFEVLLDGRKLRTPSKAALVIPTLEIAQKVAREWQSQDTKIDPVTMPVTRMANSAIDKVAHQFDAVADMLASYGETDLLCYRAAFPIELVEKQHAVWTPFLLWAETTFDAPLVLGEGIMHVAQPAASIAKLRAPVFALNTFELVAFHDLVAISGSLVLGLAALRAFKSPEDIWQASRLDENWQESQWGQDDEATELAAKKRQAFFEAFEFYQGLQVAL
ncbi:ATP12 family chaperone protein [Falsihalocynthiibacter sp. S25ZX9]|uniref:ATP12 family chaperone protein n=1 Tax=Falsihalocynthiibacter sp. S25ZX9 TaxID=3240870 RepID=UPI00350F960D